MRIQSLGGCLLLAASWVGSASAFIPSICPGNSVAQRAEIQVAGSAAGRCLKQTGKCTELFSGRDSFDEPMYLSEENAEIALQMCRDELITMFGYSAENQAVGITGEVEFVELDGCEIVVRLKGRFWHDRNMVLARVANAVQQRIPEATVRIEHPSQLQGGNDDSKSVEQFYKN